MAARSISRCLERSQVEEIARKGSAGTVLGGALVDLGTAPEGEGESEQAWAMVYVVYTRPGGFMVAAPPTPEVEAGITDLHLSDCGVRPEKFAGSVSAESNRGRRMTAVDIHLWDLPWEAVVHFFPLPPSRSRPAGIIQLELDGQVVRPSKNATYELADSWITGEMEKEIAQDYYTGEEMDEEELEPDHPAGQPEDNSATIAALRARVAELESAARYQPPRAKSQAAPAAPTHPSPSLFSGNPQQNSLDASDWAKLQNLAGRPPPRVNAKEPRRSALAQSTVRQEDIYADLEKEAIGTQETEDLFSKLDLEKLDPMQQILMVQMQQNQLLLQRLTTPKHSDPVLASLSGGDNASGSGSSGVKGCVARDTFVRTVTDLSLVARVVRNNALKELGMPESKEDGSLLQTYMEKRVPLAEHKLLTFMATMVGEGWRIGFESQNVELLGVMGRMAFFLEQCSLDSGKTQLAWLMSGWTEPPWHQLSSGRKKVGLEPFARLCHPSWVSANLAYLKDLDYTEARMNSIGRPTKAATAAANEEEVPIPKKAPKAPKGKGKKGQGQEESST